jgi:hypothetical protein
MAAITGNHGLNGCKHISPLVPLWTRFGEFKKDQENADPNTQGGQPRRLSGAAIDRGSRVPMSNAIDRRGPMTGADVRHDCHIPRHNFLMQLPDTQAGLGCQTPIPDQYVGRGLMKQMRAKVNFRSTYGKGIW